MWIFYIPTWGEFIKNLFLNITLFILLIFHPFFVLYLHSNHYHHQSSIVARPRHHKPVTIEHRAPPLPSQSPTAATDHHTTANHRRRWLTTTTTITTTPITDHHWPPLLPPQPMIVDCRSLPLPQSSIAKGVNRSGSSRIHAISEPEPIRNSNSDSGSGQSLFFLIGFESN